MKFSSDFSSLHCMHFFYSHSLNCFLLRSKIIKLCLLSKRMEINLSSGVKMKSEEDLKVKLPIKARENNLFGIRAMGRRLRAVQRNSFRKKYGNLLGLLDIEV